VGRFVIPCRFCSHEIERGGYSGITVLVCLQAYDVRWGGPAIHKSTRERHMGKGNNSQKNDKKNMKVKKDGKKQEIKSGTKKA
jgi:hypothetical protein